MKTIRLISAVLLLASAVLHIAQLGVYGVNNSIIGTVAFGFIYIVIGLFLFTPYRWALWAAIIFPFVGAVLGLGDYITSAHPVALFPLFMVIDIIVIGLCVFLIIKSKAETTGKPA